MSDTDQDLFADYEKPEDQVWTIPTDKEKGVYRFILAAARRARQLQSGARPTITTTSRKPTKIAMEEVRSGNVEVEIVGENEPWPPVPVGFGETPEAQEEFPAGLAVADSFLPGE